MKTLQVIALLLAFPAVGLPATIHVPDDHPTIQNALAAAADGDTIVVRPGIYMENIDFLGKDVICRSQLGPGVTAIDGNMAGSVITFAGGEGPDAVLEGFRVINGSGTPDSGEYLGGGIYCRNSSPLISGNLIIANKVLGDPGKGGGIYCRDGAPTISGNMISGNLVSGSLGCGAGICTEDADATITANTVTGNMTGHSGGGIYYANGQAAVSDNLIEDNYAVEAGGGVYASGSTGFVFSGNFVKGNEALRKAGGLYCFSCIATVRNNIFTMNVARGNSDHGGGAIYSDRSNDWIVNNTIVGNAASRGGGIRCDRSDPVIINTILWDNRARHSPDLAADSFSTPFTLYCNIATIPPSTTNISADPLLVDPLHLDFHLQYESPCRDTGDNTAIGLPTTDFEGDPRIADGTVDMGADEFHPHLYYLGEVSPGSSLSLRVTGLPASPVELVLGADVLDPSQLTPYGWLHLQPPFQKLGPNPIPLNGVLIHAITVPAAWTHGESHPIQALVAKELSNLMVLTVQ